MTKIQIIVTKDGNYQVKGIGFRGPDCLSKMQGIKGTLGVELEDERQYQPEFYLEPESTAIAQQEYQF